MKSIITKNIKRVVFVIAILLIPIFGFTGVSRGAESEEYISDVSVISAGSQEEAVNKLKEAGYEPVMKNIADEKPELSSRYVYVGYRTTTDPAAAMENREAGSTGSVFGESALMIAGIAMILGVVVGMVSMRVRPRAKKPEEEAEK